MAATRLRLLFAVFHALMAATGSIAAAGADYPDRPIRLLVPFTPGGGTDIIARALGQHLTGAWGQNVIIDNRAGGNTVIASEIVAKARPDGYTLLMQINTLTALPAMAKAGQGQGTISPEQFAPISLVAALPHVLVVHRSVPAASIKELVALARASPGKLNYGTPGIGTPVHLAGALFASMAGINVVPVPYKGAAEYTAALLGNEVQMVFGSAPTAIPHVRTGALRALGVTTARRIAPLPDVPTIAESGFPGYDIMSWYGVLAPAGTPHDIVARLAKEIGAATRTKKFGDALPDYEMIGNTPAAFAEFLRKDAEVSARIIAQAGAKAH
ncbi:MAG TPA: tripartite tricarboxylate transporter substrate binding protein [Burkholderiales bacterium]|nr:tripartite tricarboxylate transporter substrate binding protein [Burkholderiales bacterium]